MSAKQSTAAAAWDALAQVDVGHTISRRLADDPPPKGSRIAGELAEWGENLQRNGEERLEALGYGDWLPVLES